MHKLEVLINFAPSANQNTTEQWCDNIQLFIVYDAYGEFQQSKCLAKSSLVRTRALPRLKIKFWIFFQHKFFFCKNTEREIS